MILFSRERGTFFKLGDGGGGYFFYLLRIYTPTIITTRFVRIMLVYQADLVDHLIKVLIITICWSIMKKQIVSVDVMS